jgi:DtxR family Mn-dependent transcriptional regulator
MPTPTLEEYLETIYKIGLDGAVRPSQIADSMGVSGPTVTATLKRLEARGLVDREGTDVVLTELGVGEALEIVRKHRVAERFLVDVLALDWDVAHEEACRLEHALSGRVLDALEKLLDNPEVCPHGHPIPSASGTVTTSPGRPLSELTGGDAATVLRVAEGTEALGYLGSVGLVPGAKVAVTSVQPAGGLMAVRVDGRDSVVSIAVAGQVTVSKAAS